ncbi:nitronate monooxygenase [Leucobacter ruminantium]|uniref:Propionate 3-nitronate monooxygenase n=1 Tax=Leucobacter ruminantium TaxID=1289170 RepID=A0A939LW95_9MICO|nr:nitronate monooxygenase [Leucobacter ruminantium]MBO1804103.1 nitronate monooxygenase [Leucobacter ruminantium]
MRTPRLLDSRLPLVAAPMAGGPSSVELAASVAAAGAFPFLAGGMQTAEGLAAQIERLRPSARSFGVNLFVPGRASLDAQTRAEFAAYAAELQPEAERYGLRLDPEPAIDDDAWGEKLALLIADPVPVVSLTFGLPDPADIAALQRAGSRVLASVTSPAEARAAARTGVDGLVVQGAGAGGHSAVHEPARTPDGGRDAGSDPGSAGVGGTVPGAAEPGPETTVALVRAVRDAVDLPVIAAGGVDGPGAVRDLLASGAESVAVGTLLLRAAESGASAAHRAAIADPAFTETVVTRAFTGRPARSLRNRFADAHGATAPVAYPAVHHLTRALRQAAGRAGDTDTLHLWAGTGFRAAREAPAAEIIAWLASEL